MTDRPFLDPTDGSAQTYLTWLNTLVDAGHEVSVLSFDRFSVRWQPDMLRRLAERTSSHLILDAYRNRFVAAIGALCHTLSRLLLGRRYLPDRLERMIHARVRGRIAAFLRDAPFDGIVVNKVHTIPFIGRDTLRSSAAYKIIDMHDNYPQREVLDGVVLRRLARTDRAVFRAVAKMRPLLELFGWADQDRLLREEVALLASFDRVVFNAPEEAAIYGRHGLPAGKATVLPLPGPKGLTVSAPDTPRAYELGFIAGGALSNVEAIQFLAREIVPRLRRLAPTRRIRILVAGTIGRFAGTLLPPDMVTVLGRIDDVGTFYEQVQIVLVPLLTGTGVSVKTMEAAAYGSAIVSTTTGRRGLTLEAGRDLVVADGPDALAGAILRLLDDPVALRDLRRHAAEAVSRHHSREGFAAGVAALLA